MNTILGISAALLAACSAGPNTLNSPPTDAGVCGYDACVSGCAAKCPLKCTPNEIDCRGDCIRNCPSDCQFVLPCGAAKL